MTRTEFLRQNARDSLQKEVRAALPECWTATDLSGTIAERKAKAMAMIFDEMPLYIGEEELIVGSRTLYGHRNEFLDRSDMNIMAMPHYLTDHDREEFGGVNGEFSTKSHYTPDFGRILRMGISGIIQVARDSMEQQSSPLKRGWLNAVVIAYEAISRWIVRYGDYAAFLSAKEEGRRKTELEQISEICHWISKNPPRKFDEAVQLFWFASLATIVENFRWVNYGRVDQFLFPYYHTVSPEDAQQLVECLLLKMYDGSDIKAEYFGAQEGQLNITLGGITPDGKNAVNPLTFAFLEAVKKTRLPEPEISCRIHSLNPPQYLEKCAELSVSGINCIAYYHDDSFIASMTAIGIPEKAARDYAFDLCQDITIPGQGDFFMSGSVDLGRILLDTMRETSDNCTFPEFFEAYRNRIARNIRKSLESYNCREEAVRKYVAGDPDFLREQVKAGTIDWHAADPLMSPLPITSALYENCLETGTDLCWYGCPIADRGFMVSDPVVGINSLAALRKRVFDEKRFSISQVLAACDANFEGQEKMRQILWTAPKWANDDDYVDIPAKEIIEFACDEILKYRTPAGARHLAGIHQPHPVPTGRGLQATPEGRKAGEPVPVTLSPENGTMLNGPTAAFRSAAKIDPMKYQWNNCVMLQYFASVFQANEGGQLFAGLLRNYFAIGGTQHQPNVVNVEDLKNAQMHPEEYRDLIVRMWGVSAHFVDLPREVQDEFIARFENLSF
ncbi:MAG: pyruvate formate lyase family protein [Candidatus Merdivicinus sp.]|jgi:pyruvate-formate lyase